MMFEEESLRVIVGVAQDTVDYDNLTGLWKTYVVEERLLKDEVRAINDLASSSRPLLSFFYSSASCLASARRNQPADLR